MQYLHLLCYHREPPRKKPLCPAFHEMHQQPPSPYDREHHRQQQQQFGGTGTGTGSGYFAAGTGTRAGSETISPGGGTHTSAGLRELLVECAAAVSSSDWQRAIRCLVHLSRAASPHGDAVERVAFYFSAALARCLCSLSAPDIRSLLHLNNLHFLLQEEQAPPPSLDDDVYYYCSSGVEEQQSAYLALNQVTPFTRFSHLSANQAILEAVDNERAVHIVDLGIMQGLQWPPLMQALVERRRLKQLEEEQQQQQLPPPEHVDEREVVDRQLVRSEEQQQPSSSTSTPSATTLTLRITGTGSSMSLLEQTGARLRDFARTLNLDFEFNPVVTSNRRVVAALQQCLELRRGEALVVNCMAQLHKLLPAAHRSALPQALEFIRSLCPRVLTLAEMESEHDLNQSFLERFLATLDHYSAVFDSLEATLPPRSPQRLMIERLVLAKEITGMVLEQGADSDNDDDDDAVVRHQSFANWRRGMESTGFQLVPPSAFAIAQAKLLLRLHYPADGYRLEDEQHGSLFLTWHNKPLVALSSWNCC